MPSPNSTHRRLIARASIGLALGAALALTSCANPLDSLVNTVTSSAADELVSGATGVEIDGIGSSEIPEDFPSSIPLPDQAPTTAIRHSEDGRTGWMLHYDNMNGAAFDSLLASFQANGFTEESSTDLAGAMRLEMYSNDEFSVNLSLLGEEDDEQILQVMVFPR